MEETVTTFGETTECWFAIFFGPFVKLYDMLWSFVMWLWS